jgi:hypothetical protein
MYNAKPTIAYGGGVGQQWSYQPVVPHQHHAVAPIQQAHTLLHLLHDIAQARLTLEIRRAEQMNALLSDCIERVDRGGGAFTGQFGAPGDQVVGTIRQYAAERCELACAIEVAEELEAAIQQMLLTLVDCCTSEVRCALLPHLAELHTRPGVQMTIQPGTRPSHVEFPVFVETLYDKLVCAPDGSHSGEYPTQSTRQAAAT